MTDKPNILLTNEIASSVFLVALSDDNIGKLKANPSAFLTENTGVDIPSDVEIAVVDNSDRSVHLALPYYSAVETISSEEFSDNQLEEIVGGEIIILGTAAGAGIGFLLGFKLGVGFTALQGIAIGAAFGAAIGTGAAIATGTAVGITIQDNVNRAEATGEK